MVSTPRVLLVTGASSGFGRSMANYLQDQGYRVYGTSRRAVDGPNPHGAFSLVHMDVTDKDSVDAAIAQIIDREGRIDAVVSNAGMGIAGSIEETSDAETLVQFDTNFFGNHRVVRAALPHLRARERAHIIIVGSLGGVFGLPFQGMYCATKFALEGYCEALRMELRRTPVRVTILEPGDFATGFTDARAKIAAAGPDSPYRDAFDRALKVIADTEVNGEDPILLAHAVKDILEMDNPPIRRPVVGPSQEAFVNAKQDYSPDELEKILFDWFDGASPQ